MDILSIVTTVAVIVIVGPSLASTKKDISQLTQQRLRTMRIVVISFFIAIPLAGMTLYQSAPIDILILMFTVGISLASTKKDISQLTQQRLRTMKIVAI